MMEFAGTDNEFPSMDSVWPITPPGKLEYVSQLVPNWNSNGMPVTTPKVKLNALAMKPPV